MATQGIDADYSGNPLRPVEELTAGDPPPFPDLLIQVLPDGTEVVCWGNDEYYHRKPDGQPDFDRPIAFERIGQ